MLHTILVWVASLSGISTGILLVPVLRKGRSGSQPISRLEGWLGLSCIILLLAFVGLRATS